MIHTGFVLVKHFLEFIHNGARTRSEQQLALQCSCQCPQGTYHGYIQSLNNSVNQCLTSCQDDPLNPCNHYDTYACLGDLCEYSRSYRYLISSDIVEVKQPSPGK